MDLYSKSILGFLRTLELDVTLPDGVEILNPYKQDSIFTYVEKFYNKYYHDHSERVLIAGINPGRLGGGLTGIPFTDPVKLEDECGIENDMPRKKELSADFVYQVISAYGGKGKFYQRFYITSVCPLGFIKGGKNLNYYDLRTLQEAVLPFIVQSLKAQIDFGLNREVAYCLGEGKNYKFLALLNQREHFFDRIVPLPHPRFIMQYRRKHLAGFIGDYIAQLNASHVS